METKVAELKIFVDQCKQHPEMLHMPALKFFKEYIESFGGKVPPPSASADAGAKECPFSGKKDTEPMETDTDAPEPEAKPEAKKEVPTIPMPELDNEGVIEADVGEPLPMGDADKEVSDEDLEKANEERDSAAAAFSEGEFDRALQHFTNAIELNPGSAMLHAKRANCLLKLRRPVAAIADCSKAISINPDSATAYKFRGRANRLLGKWLEAHTDLAMACKLDYDDVANEWLKEVEPNAKKLKDWQLAKERQEREIEIEERRERVRRAQEANRKAAEEEKARREAGGAGAGGFPGGFPGMPGGFPGAPGGFPGAPGGPDEFPASGPGGIPPGMAGLFSDPEVMAGLQDPELQPILLDIMSNPANLMKHIGNPKVMKVISKMKGMFGGGAGPDMEEGGCCGGEDPTCGSGAAHAHEGAKRAAPEQPAPQPPRKAPEPDLD